MRPAQASVTWERPTSGVGGLRYDVLLNGQLVGSDLSGTSSSSPTRGSTTAPTRCGIRAHDRAGQSAFSQTLTLRVDGTAPVARATVRGRRVVVQVLDRAGGESGSASGVNAAKTQIAWGDGSISSQRKLAGHSYRRAGLRTVRVRTKDKAGNGTTITLRVRIR